jgi:hypothetical protein
MPCLIKITNHQKQLARRVNIRFIPGKAWMIPVRCRSQKKVTKS